MAKARIGANLLSLDQLLLNCQRNGLGAIRGAQLPHNRTDVELDSALANGQTLGDFFGRQAFDKTQPQDFTLFVVELRNRLLQLKLLLTKITNISKPSTSFYYAYK